MRHKLGFKYEWRVRIWGDIFNHDDEKKYLKEIVSGGNIALLPKLMSAENISMRDTKAIVEYLMQLDFYKDFSTYTQIKAAELGQKAEEAAGEVKSVGRPSIPDGNVENDATAASKASGTNTAENRE